MATTGIASATRRWKCCAVHRGAAGHARAGRRPRPDGPYRYYGHKGFDYRDVRRELSERFTIARRIFTPMRMLGPVLNSQAWFVCTPR